ncbi:MAG: class I SAM-dependent methyltransferase [Brooklawnia sp.]|nr:class I SAM-dependent methyltransferase [Brooklawnia sp.]
MARLLMSKTPRTPRTFWDWYAAAYDLIWDSPFTTTFAAEIARRVCGDVIVDLGCGTGLATATLNAHVIGVDSSAEMLRRAKGRCDQVVLASAERTPLHDESVNAVVVANVVHACASPTAVVREALRIVQPGGRVLITWPSDHATIDSIANVQRSLGLPKLSAARAKRLATAFGILSAMTRVPRRATPAIMSELAVFVREPIRPQAPPALFGMQQMLCLRVRPAGRNP